MIVDVILGLLYALVEPLVSLLPTVVFPFTVNDLDPVMEPLWRLNYVLPFISPAQWIVALVLATFGALVLYRAGLWTYSRIRG